MTLLGRFRQLAFVLVLISIASAALAQQSVGLFLIAGTLAAISWFVTEGPRGKTLPRWVSNLLVVAVSLNVFVDLFQNRDDVLGVLGRFTVWLTLIKLYERRTARDHGHLLLLSLLLMMTGCLQAHELSFGVLLACYVVLGLYVLLLYQLHTSYELTRGLRQAAIPPNYRLVPPVRPIIGPRAVGHFRLMSAGVALVSVFLSMIVFVSFPRDVGADMLGSIRTYGRTQSTRFSWNIDLITGGRITESKIKVLDVRLTNSDGTRAFAGEPLRLRGAVLNRYDGRGRWSTHEPTHTIQSLSADFVPLADDWDSPDELVVQRVALNRPESGVAPIFSVYAPVAVRMRDHTELEYGTFSQTVRTLARRNRVDGYDVLVRLHATNDELQSLAAPVSMMEWRGNRSSELHTIRSHAQRLLNEHGMPTIPPANENDRWKWNDAAASVFTEYLRSEEFTYTLDLSNVSYSGPDADPIVEFLFRTKRGHCEYFSSALAALCHSVDIPARVVAGYVAYDFDESSQRYHILESNAHAWVEVGTSDYRWTVFDPTPPDTLRSFHSIESTFADHLRWAYDRFEGDWATTVMSFDRRSQTDLATSFGRRWSDRFSSSAAAIRDWMRRVNEAFYFGPAGYIWMGIVGFALIIAVYALITLMRRSLAIRRTARLQHVHGSEYQRMLRQLGFYVDMLDVLRRAGIPKPNWQPPLAFVRVIARKDRAIADKVQDITNEFYAARYGGHRPNRTELQQIQDKVHDLAQTLNVKL